MTSRQIEILQIAQDLFREKGYSAASVRDIAKAAKVEPASLYSHMNSKEDLLDATCFDMAGKFLNSIQEVNDIYFDAAQKLKMAVDGHVKILTEHLSAAVVFQREWRHLGEPRRSEFIKLRNQYEAEFRTIVQNGIDEGLFNEVDKKMAVLTILSSLNWIVEWYRPDGPLNARQIAEQLFNFILTGLKKDVL